MLIADDLKQLKQLAKDNKIPRHTGWKNFSHSQQLPKALVFDIPNRLALQAVVREIHKINKSRTPATKITYHAASGGKKEHSNAEYNESFSFSPCAGADVILRLTGEEFQQYIVDAATKRVKAGAGLQIWYLDKDLYEKHGLSLPTSSLFGYPTHVGLGAVAGHGTGNKESGFAGLIHEFTICRPDGEIVTLNARHDDFETIRAAHLGLFGVVIDQTLQCRTGSKIHARRQATHIPDYIKQLKDGLPYKERRVSVMYVPLYHADDRNQTGANNILIVKADAVSRKTPDKNDPALLEYAYQDVLIKLQDALKIPDLLSKDPKLIPDTMRYVVSPVSIGQSYEAVGPWGDMMHYQTAFPRKIDDMDFLFPISRDSHEAIEALEFVVATLEDFAKKGQYPVTYAIYMRFFVGTNGGLSTSQHEEGALTCAFDIVSNPETPGYPEFKSIMEDYFINKRHAKPHWGKTVPLDVDYEAMYGKGFHDFKDALGRWYQDCGLTMDMSPLITPYFATILKVPMPAVTPVPLPAKAPIGQLAFFPPPPSPRTQQKYRDAMHQAAEKMVEDGAEGSALKQRIKRI